MKHKESVKGRGVSHMKRGSKKDGQSYVKRQSAIRKCHIVSFCILITNKTITGKKPWPSKLSILITCRKSNSVRKKNEMKCIGKKWNEMHVKKMRWNACILRRAGFRKSKSHKQIMTHKQGTSLTRWSLGLHETQRIG